MNNLPCIPFLRQAQDRLWVTRASVTLDPAQQCPKEIKNPLPLGEHPQGDGQGEGWVYE